VTVLCAVLVVVTCVLLSRVCFGLAALLLRERRSRELTGILLLALVVFVLPTAVFVASLQWHGAVPGPLDTAARVLGDTPFGAAWALPALFSAGDATGGWIALVVAVGTPLVLAALWYLLTVRMLSSTSRPARAGRAELGWFVVVPGTPGGAIAARSLVYWLHDGRYLLSLVAVPAVAVLCVLPLMVAGVPFSTAVLLPVPLIALFLGWMPHNDVAYDATAVWIHFAADVRGVSDRVGRLVPILLIGIPLLAVLIPVALVLHGDWSMLPLMIGICASLFLSGLGLSSISSALAPYPVTLPGDSPLRQPERAGVASVLSPALVLLGALACAVPIIGFAAAALTGGTADASRLALWGGVVIGAAVLVGGVAGGSAVFEHRRSRLMEFAESL
jgi:ABC-2 type transport system permease protein